MCIFTSWDRTYFTCIMYKSYNIDVTIWHIPYTLLYSHIVLKLLFYIQINIANCSNKIFVNSKCDQLSDELLIERFWRKWAVSTIFNSLSLLPSPHPSSTLSLSPFSSRKGKVCFANILRNRIFDARFYKHNLGFWSLLWGSGSVGTLSWSLQYWNKLRNCT